MAIFGALPFSPQTCASQRHTYSLKVQLPLHILLSYLPLRDISVGLGEEQEVEEAEAILRIQATRACLAPV